MKLRIILLFTALVASASYNESLAQTCDSLVSVSKKDMAKPSKKDKNTVFISDGQTYRAFLDEDQTAEFNTTFFKGGTYRIAATAGTKDKYVIFEVYNTDMDLIFSSSDHGNTPYWDFKADTTTDIIIQVKLDPDKKSSGCSVMLIGFKQKKN
jgi:hypothetical protein